MESLVRQKRILMINSGLINFGFIYAIPSFISLLKIQIGIILLPNEQLFNFHILKIV
jgi:hypothetical protein